MPVKFRGVSEYSSTYQWSPSYRSARFEPTSQQASPEAGLRSDQMNYLMEPNFAAKRRVPHRQPEAASCLLWQNDNYDDNDSESGQGVSAVPDRNKNLKTYVVRSKEPKARSISVNSAEKLQQNKNEDGKKASYLNESLSTWEKSEKKNQPKDNIVDSPVMKHKENLKKHVSASEKKINIVKSNDKPSRLVQRKDYKDIKRSPGKQKRASPKKEPKTNNIPLKYRSLQQRMHSAHQTEYQKMYTKPTHFIPSSPLISALDVVHASSPAISPHKSPKMQAKSEYGRKFQAHSPLSKSLPSFSSPASLAMKLKVKNLPSSAYRQQHSSQKMASEYAQQFPDREISVEQQTKVLDEARHNKMNREGTGFDRDHLNQLHSGNNQYWDMSSASGSNVATSNNENVTSYKNRKTEVETQQKGLPKQFDGCEVGDNEVESIEAMEKDSLDAASTASTENALSTKPVARKLAWDEKGDDDDDESTVEESVATESDAATCYKGRLSTPHLNEMGGAVRTHHDLTTPCAGGTLLTSPERPHERSTTNYRPASVSSSTSSVVNVNSQVNKTSDVLAKSNQSKTKRVSARLNKTTPVKPVTDLCIPRRLAHTVRVPIQGSLRSQEFQHCGRNSRPTSTMEHISLVSSQSAASVQNLLQKSMQRQNFWQEG